MAERKRDRIESVRGGGVVEKPYGNQPSRPFAVGVRLPQGRVEPGLSSPPRPGNDVTDLTEFHGPNPRPTGGGGIGQPKRPGERRFRHVADATEQARIRRAKLGPCVVCRWLNATQQYASTLHHVVARSLGGDDCEANEVPVCGDGTTGHHGGLEAHDVATCQAFAAAVQQYDPDAYVYAIEKLGEDGWLRRYHVRFEGAA